MIASPLSRALIIASSAHVSTQVYRIFTERTISKNLDRVRNQHCLLYIRGPNTTFPKVRKTPSHVRTTEPRVLQHQWTLRLNSIRKKEGSKFPSKPTGSDERLNPDTCNLSHPPELLHVMEFEVRPLKSVGRLRV